MGMAMIRYIGLNCLHTAQMWGSVLNLPGLRLG